MTSDPSDRTASIHLDYGADSAAFAFEDLFVSHHGLQLKTRWCFTPGAELSVNFQVADPNTATGCRLLKTQGVVADCQPVSAGGRYVVTVVFVELTDDILEVVKDFSSTLAMPG